MSHPIWSQQPWKNPLVNGYNRVTMHSPLGAYPDLESAKSRQDSPFRMSLNGLWKFQLTQSPEMMPDDFLSESMNEKWIELLVPSNWQLDERVPDYPIYTNINYPFQKQPPEPPVVNPTGWYRTSFMLPESWDGREVFLWFESCDSACLLWVNGQEVGYSEDSKLPHEFCITPFIHKGLNHLGVMVPRYCDGFWLEDQDYWHLSGIQRDVILYSKPIAHIRDFKVHTVFDNQYHNAELVARVWMNEVSDLSHYQIELTLFDPRGDQVDGTPVRMGVSSSSPMYGDTTPERASAFFRIPVRSPLHWTAETPYLYTVVLTLYSPEGKAIDFESCRIGFRQIEIKNSILLLNGRRLVFRGVNLHEHHPEKGRALSLEDMRKELVLMKQFNFNAIRTSHYPHHSAFYDLCDELGFYIIDEANLETHGIGALASKSPLWMQAYMERAQRMALRDKNHPSVIIWSLGNESLYGPHHAAMAAWLRSYDPTRPIHYENGLPGPSISDLFSVMYPPLNWLRNALTNPQETRPFMMCEYAYSKGNALGNFCKYWELIDQIPRFQGGFIWDWRDKALVKRVNGKKEWAYGNEFDNGIGPDGFSYGQYENPQMCLNGVVNPDLTPKPGLWEVQKIQAPVSFWVENQNQLHRGVIEIRNRYLALDLSHLDLFWEVTREGEIIEKGMLPLPPIPPSQSESITLPIAEIVNQLQPNYEYWLNLYVKYREQTPWCDVGHLVTWEQFSLSTIHYVPCKIDSSGTELPLNCTLQDSHLRIQGTDFCCVFSLQTGFLEQWITNQYQLLSRPLQHAFMRARTDNDYILDRPGNYFQEWQEAGLLNLTSKLIQFSKSQPTKGSVKLFTTHQYASDHAKKKGEIMVHTNYHIWGNGIIEVEVICHVYVPVTTLPRVGMKLGIVPGFEQLTWYGRGPHESYPDRKKSALIGRYESTVDKQFFPFVDPCECGGHQDTRWFELKHDDGTRIRFVGVPTFHFSVLHYIVEDLIHARHVYELSRVDDIQIHLDGFHLGLGGDTGWSPNVHSEFLVPPGTYRYGFRMMLPQQSGQ